MNNDLHHKVVPQTVNWYHLEICCKSTTDVQWGTVKLVQKTLKTAEAVHKRPLITFTRSEFKNAYVCAASPAGPWFSETGWAILLPTPSSAQHHLTAGPPSLRESVRLLNQHSPPDISYAFSNNTTQIVLIFFSKQKQTVLQIVMIQWSWNIV